MEIIKGLDKLKEPLSNPVITLGNFDGVHLGHQRIFQKVNEEARRLGGESVVVTFEPHPMKVLHPDRCPPLLTPFRQKMMYIERTGIDRVLCIEFTTTFAEISPYEFIRSVLVDKVHVRKIVVGYNYHFGKGKSGDVRSLKDTCKQFGVEVEVMEAMKIDQIPVSSSTIRTLIKEGKVDLASRLLGRDYLVIGKVIEGAKRGRGLGFPTANIAVTEELYPKIGVYAVEVLWNTRRFRGVANVGVNPTFAKEPRGARNPISFEIFILDFDQQIYGEEIQVSFKKRIRDEIRFASPALLVEQMKNDVEWARQNVFRLGPPAQGYTPQME